MTRGLYTYDPEVVESRWRLHLASFRFVARRKLRLYSGQRDALASVATRVTSRADGGACRDCGGMTVPTGACSTCSVCGSTGGCG